MGGDSDNPPSHYKRIKVQGVECIVWLYNTNSENLSNSVKRARKKEKDEVGGRNLDVPMLDTKTVRNSRQYCDLIMITNNLTAWEAAVRNQFLSHHQTTRKISGGEQISLTCSKTGLPFITVTLYPGTKKIMIQPGQRSEANLLNWLGFYSDMLKIVTGSQQPSSTSVSGGSESNATSDLNQQGNITLTQDSDDVNPALHSTAQSSASVPPGGMSSSCSVTNASNTAFDTCLCSSSPTSTARMPTTPSSPVDNHVTRVDHHSMPLLSPVLAGAPTSRLQKEAENQQTERKIIVNELLFFMQNKLDSTSMDTTIELCAGFYSEVDVEESKKLLYDTVHPPDRLIKRRGQDKNRDNLRDICTVLYSTDVTKQPVFVAKSLLKLPPVTSHEHSIGKILRELDGLKMTVNKIMKNCVNVKDQVTTENLRVHPMPIPTPQKATISIQVNAIDLATSSQQNRSTQVSNPEDTQSGEFITIDYDPCVSTLSPDSTVSDNKESAPVTAVPARNTNQSHPTGHDNRESAPVTAVPARITNESHPTGHDEPTSWTKVQRKSQRVPSRHTSGVTGTGKSTCVRSSEKTNPRSPYQRGNRTVTGVFVTRLGPYTTTNQLFQHIRTATGCTCQPEKLQTKYGGYSSFYIAADRKLRATLLDPQIWPPRVLVKPFYS